jgi:hypothetical protein
MIEISLARSARRYRFEAGGCCCGNGEERREGKKKKKEPKDATSRGKIFAPAVR